MPDIEINLQDSFRAAKRIQSVIQKTPLVYSRALSARSGANVYLKLENLQQTGSFKIRGAANKMLSLSEEEKNRGVITVSSGNHGRAVAAMAQHLDIDAVICMSERVPDNKVNAIRDLGAEVRLHGASYEEAEILARNLQAERGLTFVDPFDDPHVIAGQGTVALEILADLPEIDTVLVPLSGGGLMSGISMVMKSTNPNIHTVGVSMDRAPVMYHSLKAGKPIEMEEEDTLADALVGNIGLNNRYTFNMIQEFVDDVVLVSESQIADGIVFALQEHHLVVEGGGVVGISALKHNRLDVNGCQVAVVVSGGSIQLGSLTRILMQASGLSLDTEECIS